MKKLTLPKKEKKSENQIAVKGGVYSIALTAIVLAILVLFNVLVSALPATWTKFDMSSTKLYSITSNTKAVVNALKDDVTIYWIVQSGQEDQIIEHLLNKYDAQSSRIEIVKKNPDMYPTFAEKYTTEEVANNSLVVECGERSRYIGYDDIYVSELNVYTYNYDTSFDGEGAITSAIDYVVNEEQPKLYILEGHGEMTVPEGFHTQITKENIETKELSLLTEKKVPDDADCVLIYGPESDISGEEKDLLAEYAKNGGKLMVFAGPTEDGTLKNLYSLIEEYGVTAKDGIVVETDQNYYAFDAPYVLLPEIAETELTAQLKEKGYYVIVPIAQGMTVRADSTAVTLLTTSGTSFSKAAGYDLETYEKEEKDVDGPFTLAVSIECGNEGQIIWFATSNLLDDTYNSYSSGANYELGMRALSDLMGESDAVAIQSKTLNYDYLTIADATASLLKVVMIGVCPLVYLGAGIIVILRRRKMNEAV